MQTSHTHHNNAIHHVRICVVTRGRLADGTVHSAYQVSHVCVTSPAGLPLNDREREYDVAESVCGDDLSH